MRYGPLLIVEDSDEDFYAVRRALGTTLPCALVRCSTGSDALQYLLQQGQYAQAERPALILLDLNLPGTDGRTVLAQLKQDSTLKSIPVVVMSTSSSPVDIRYCYATGCSGYVVKPLEYNRLVAALQSIRTYWFSTVVLPHLHD
jgi:CheY-like chemotaxis protein